MQCIVIYASRSGNTRTVADAIAGSLGRHGTVETLAVESAPARIPAGTDLLVIGGPTEGHGISEPMKAYLERLDGESVRDVACAVFDTRLDWPRWLSGSAADRISDALRERGARVIAREESFIVTMEPVLQPGEEARAAEWGDRLAILAGAAAPVEVAAR
jgi:flavodoxin